MLANRRVMLINPPQDLRTIMGDSDKLVAQMEPLGLLYLAAVLLQHGYDVQVIDAEADPHTSEELLTAVEDYDPAVVGITCLTPTAPPAVELGLQLRAVRPQSVVVMGNVHAAEFAEPLLRLGACDYVVHGEGEFILLELLRCLEAGGDAAEVAGLSLLVERRYLHRPPPLLARDLDVIPPPARHLLGHIRYDAGTVNNLTYLRPRGTVTRHAVGSRGCVFRCSFCVVHHEHRFRYHSPQRVVDEMIDLQANHACGFLFFTDSIFVANRKRVHAICAEIERRGVRLPWGCEGHVRCVDQEMLTAMRRAGCVSIAYGIETASPRLLQRINKSISIEQVARAVELTRRAGIASAGLFILGLPSETRAEMEQSIDLALRLPLDMAQFSMFVPYPGSQDYADLVAAGAIDTGVRVDGRVDLNVWRRYSPYVGYGEAGQAVYVPPGMSFEELFAMQRRAMRRFYLRPRQVWSNVQRLRPGNVLAAARAAGTLLFKRRGRAKQPDPATCRRIDTLLPAAPRGGPRAEPDTEAKRCQVDFSL